MKTFSVIIISYNGKEFLRNTLQAVLRSDAKPLEVIVVDDASTDNTTEMIQEEFPGIVLVRNSKNSGTSASRNRGAKKAKGDYIIFLDNDIEVRPDTFKNLVEFLDDHSDAGIVTARLFSEDGSQRDWNVGYDPNRFKETVGSGLSPLRKRFPKSKAIKAIYERCNLNLWDYANARTVDWVVEECFAMPRALFENIGGFDEQFFMYYEGPDLCKRVREAGMKVYITPDATAVVHEGHTHSSWKRLKLFEQSKYHYYKKHYFYLKSNPISFWSMEIFAVIPQAIQVWKSKDR